MLTNDKRLLEGLVRKYGKNNINEALRDSDSFIKDMLSLFAQSSSGVQSALYKQKLKDANSVDIVSLKDVFTDEEIRAIKRYVRPRPKECYRNAYNLADYFRDKGVKYVEGYLNVHGLPIEHAFNELDGVYFDCTIELALNKNVTDDTYVSIGEFDVDEVREVLLQNKFYGQIYETIFLNNYKER